MSLIEQQSTGTAVDVERKPPSLGEQLKQKEGQFNAALPAHIPVERFMRVVMTAVQNNPALAQADRQSLWNASMRAAQDGLLPDGREGALVIYKTKEKQRDGKEVWIEKVQWMPMIAGIRKKVRNSGEIATWDAQVVHKNDHFEFELGDDPFIKHKPALDNPGEVIAAYSVAVLKSGEKSREVMTRAQIEKVRSASRSKDRGPWVDWFEEMCRKTVARRHSKLLPMSTDLDDLIRRDDSLYDMAGARDHAQALAGGKPLSLAAKMALLAERPAKDIDQDVPASNGVPVRDESAEEDPKDAGAGAAPASEPFLGDDPDPEAARQALLDRLRPLTMDGMRPWSVARNKLTDAEKAVLRPGDLEGLNDAARKAGP